MRGDDLLKCLTKLSENLDNVTYDSERDKVIFQESGNPFSFVYYQTSTYPYKGERLNVYVYDNSRQIDKICVDGQKIYDLYKKVVNRKFYMLENYVNKVIQS